MPRLSPNDRYEINQIPAAEHINIQNDHAQYSHYQHVRRMYAAQEHLHQPQFIDWASGFGSRAEHVVDIYRNERQYLSISRDEPIRQIIYSDSYQNWLNQRLDAYEDAISRENEAGVPPMTIADVSEYGNYALRAMVESEEEYSHDEDIIFDAVSEEESTDDERGFEGDDEGSDDDHEDGDDDHEGSDGDHEDGDDEDSDSCMDLSEDDSEATLVAEEDSPMRIPTGSVLDRDSPAIFVGEEILESEWPSSAWQNAFNRTEDN